MVPLPERLEFYKYMSAASAFEQAMVVCDHLAGKDDKDPLFYPLMTALHALYGRPFKQRKAIRLTRDIVPAQFLNDHDAAIKLRDKVFAHFDEDGVKIENKEFHNKVVVRVEGGRLRRGIEYLFPKGARVPRMKTLAETLKNKCLYHAGKIWKRHMTTSGISMGDYEVNIKPECNRLLIRR